MMMTTTRTRRHALDARRSSRPPATRVAQTTSQRRRLSSCARVPLTRALRYGPGQPARLPAIAGERDRRATWTTRSRGSLAAPPQRERSGADQQQCSRLGDGSGEGKCSIERGRCGAPDDIGADAQPIGIEHRVARPALQVGDCPEERVSLAQRSAWMPDSHRNSPPLTSYLRDEEIVIRGQIERVGERYREEYFGTSDVTIAPCRLAGQRVNAAGLYRIQGRERSVQDRRRECEATAGSRVPVVERDVRRGIHAGRDLRCGKRWRAQRFGQRLNRWERRGRFQRQSARSLRDSRHRWSSGGPYECCAGQLVVRGGQDKSSADFDLELSSCDSGRVAVAIILSALPVLKKNALRIADPAVSIVAAADRDEQG